MTISRYDKENKKVVLTDQDIKLVEDFYSSFKIPMSGELEDIIKTFKTKGEKFTVRDQELFRIAIAGSILYTDHPLFNSDIFTKNIKESCEAELFESRFNLDVEEELSK